MDKNDAPLTQLMEVAAQKMGIAPSTIGERAGQGGRFYARLKSGARCWPETEAAVRRWIAQNAGVHQ